MSMFGGQMGGMRQPMRPPQPTPSFGPRPGGFGGFNQGPPPGQWSPPGGNVLTRTPAFQSLMARLRARQQHQHRHPQVMGPAPNQRPPQNQWGGPGPRGPPRPQGNQGGSGLLMDMPGAGAGGYGYGGGYGGGYGAPGTILGQLKMQCPQGQMVFATGADKCKDLVILEAIYDAKTMRPLYRWVPPINQMDPTSIPDNLKDQIQNVLIQKVQSQPNRMATPKQKALQNALGDPPNYAKPMFGISMW